MKTSTTHLNKILIYSLSIIFIIGIWYLSSFLIGKSYILPYPHKVIESLFKLFKDKGTYSAIGYSIWRFLLGFFISFILALGLSLLSYLNEKIEIFLKPLVIIMKAVPTICILLVVLIWLPSKISPILVAGLVLFPMMYNANLTAFKGIDKKLIELSKVYKVSLFDKIKKLYIPSVLDPMFTESKSSISLAVKVTIAAEVLAHSTISIGIKMNIAKTYFEMDNILAWTIVAILLAVLFEGILAFILYLLKRRDSHEHKVEKHS